MRTLPYPPIRRLAWLVPLLVLFAGCERGGQAVESGALYGADAAADTSPQAAAASDEGAVASEPLDGPIALPDPNAFTWDPLPLASGEARVGCGHVLDDGGQAADDDPVAGGHGDEAVPGEAFAGDGARTASAGDGAGDLPEASEGESGADAASDADPGTSAPAGAVPLASLERDAIEAALSPCVEHGTVQLHYRGKIEHDFTALMQRVSAVAGELGLDQRLLELDSSGGHIEDAIRAGDAIAEAGWTIRVREDAMCHSSCVLVLAAGDMRLIAGRVGVHRMVRIRSSATSRAELDQELRDTLQQMRDYLQRNGASAALADMMTTVPNHGLQLLTGEELERLGLTGRNAAEEDLQRIELARKCGEDFVRRRDRFFRAFHARCSDVEGGVEEIDACAAGLGERYGFPDDSCPDDGPVPAQAAALTRLEQRYADARAASGAKGGQGGSP